MQGLRVAVEGCGHGTLDAIYASVAKACIKRNWDGVDVLIIGGDFQAVRNASDLTVMSCPVKYRDIGDFHHYYSGTRKAPYLTLFVGGNHEASSHLWELFYGGWVAPSIYYMGAANVLRIGGVRIVGMSGIWKGYNYKKTHHERLPYNQDDVKSIYHVREIDIRKLLQLSSPVDVAVSHDWPKGIENHGDSRSLFRMKPDFEQESKNGMLGNQAALYVMDRLRPHYWFAAHLHCKFPATKIYGEENNLRALEDVPNPPLQQINHKVNEPAFRNEDEIDLDMDDNQSACQESSQSDLNSTLANQDKISLLGNDTTTAIASAVPLEIRAQLPVAFTRQVVTSSQAQPGQPIPAEITNTTVRFLALDKCLPGRKFLQLLEITPHKPTESIATCHSTSLRPKPKFEYDPEWLAITRVFAPAIILGDKSAKTPHDLGEAHYLPLIKKEMQWVDENVVMAGKLAVPENFAITAPIFQVDMAESMNEGPLEYNNPQMQQYCDLVGIENKFFASEEDRAERFRQGPAAPRDRRDGGFSQGRGSCDGVGRGKGRGRGRGWRGRGYRNAHGRRQQVWN